MALILSGAPAAAYAQNNTIYACVTITTGAVRVVATAGDCRNNESPLSWNIQGPAGATGATGPQGPAGPAFPTSCPADSVLVGTTCVDTYEASVWQIPSGNTALIGKVKNGTATLAELQAGGFLKGASGDDYDPNCPDTGNNCTDLYAASVPGVTPSAYLTWFQAQQFCRAAGKRLLTNAEWQSAAAGTPDPGTDNESTDCNISGPPYGVTNTGSRSSCVSNAGAFDMVGNLSEWVGDWSPPATDCQSGLFGTNDWNCMTINPTATFTPSGPATLLRGGNSGDGTDAGVFAVVGVVQPSDAGAAVGFRCAR